jgi:4-carboxymuconolactone decarboxylase
MTAIAGAGRRDNGHLCRHQLSCPPRPQRWLWLTPAAVRNTGELVSEIKERVSMTVNPNPPSAARDKVRATVPKLIDLTEKVLFGDVWERPQLSKRDRSLITCAALVALNRTEQLKGHLERALNNGVTPEEIGELITHLAFYGGWPVAMSGALVAKDVLEQHKT